jgi:imidazolonepropionase-like amidohydrolase
MTVLLRARHLFDGVRAPMTDGAILVDADRIVAVGRASEVDVPPGADVVDLGDRALLPGLIDAHIHLTGDRDYTPAFPRPALDALRAAADARRVLESGFTTVRDCGSGVAIDLRTAIEEGTAIGPRILAAGAPLSQTGGHSDWHALPHDLLPRFRDHAHVVDGVEECRKAVRLVVRSGADLVKICTTGGVGSERDHMTDEHFSMDEIRVVVEEAHRARRRVAAHAQGKSGVLNAVRAGVDSVEHGYFIDEECVDAMLERGTALVPTFGLIETFRRSLEDATGLPPWRARKQRQCIDAMAISFPLAARAGVPIATGSDDFGAPGRELGRSAEELVAMVSSGGIAPLDVLRYATTGGARVLGLEDEVGLLAEGRLADVIAVDGRPWERIESVRDVAFVMHGGTVVRRPPAGERQLRPEAAGQRPAA